MYKIRMKCIAILAVLLICLIPISSAARPWYLHNELYTAQCGVLKEVPANYGILANDLTGTTVIDPELITIDPKYGTIDVAADGSFVYDPSPDISSGSYVIFRYKATNGVSESKNSGLAKIQISCKCRSYAPDISLSTPITREEIIASIKDEADCLGCGDTTPSFDFSAIPVGDVPSGPYPYSVKCKGCNQARGTVAIEADSECSGLPDQCPDDGDLCTIEQCEGGRCVSEPVICAGGMCCPDLGCFDFLNSNDPNNCGGCGKICPSGSCLYGTCMDSPPVLGIADWDFGCAPNDIEVRVRITDDVGVVSATFNDNAMVLIEGDNKDGVWLYTVDGSDKKLGDCIPATINAFDTIGQTAGLNFQVCWLITGC